MEFINSSSLEILNRGNVPTFCSGNRQEVIDISLGSYRLLESINAWEVSSKPSFSDPRYFVHSTRLCYGTLVRNPRGTNWGSFRRDLREKLERASR